MSLSKKITKHLHWGLGAALSTNFSTELGTEIKSSEPSDDPQLMNPQLADMDADLCEQVTTPVVPKLERTHPIYSDGTLILIGDQVRSHEPIKSYESTNGGYYEGEVTGVCSSSILCMPTLDVPVEDGMCDLLYVVSRAPETQAHQIASLELARVKLARGEYLGPRERAALLEAVSRH